METITMNFICDDNDTEIYQGDDNKFYRKDENKFIEVAHIMRFANNKVTIEWIDVQPHRGVYLT